MTDSILRVAGLTKRFGDILAVDCLSIEVRRGEILGFLGPNGAGKTTALRMMCGLLRPDAGLIELDGRPLDFGRARALTAIGVSPQNLVIWETLTCLEQLEFMGSMYGLPRARSRARSEELLTVFGLTDKAHRLGRTLSGGMQRRLNIALGLVHEPELLFLDEPQAGLDPQSRVLVRDYVRSLRGKMTVVITTHDMEEAEKLSDRVCIIDRGRLLALDTVADIKRRFAGDEVTEIAVDADARELGSLLERLPPDLGFVVNGNTLCLPSSPTAAALLAALQEIDRRGLRLEGVRTRQSTLEDIFIRLTGRSLRE
jgi:ABC-2 type transport system ATP-binding protein